jgi:Tfp pilus assembly protein PilV
MTREPPVRFGDAGISLIEAVIAMFVLATAVLALVAGLGTSIVATDMHRKSVTADAVVRNWAEKLVAAPWVPCAPTTAAGYQAAALGVTTPAKFVTPVIVSIDYWDGNGSAVYGASCAVGTATDTVQRITLSEYSTDRRGGQRLQIVKRKP